MTRVALTYNEKRSDNLDDLDDESEAEFDSASSIAAIENAIAQAGHDVVRVCVDRPVRALVDALEAAAPALVFNIAEGRIGRFREAFYPALFEQLGLAYTGSDAGVLALTLDKALTKRIVAG